MKKHLVKFTLMLLAIALGVSNAFAEDVYTKTGSVEKYWGCFFCFMVFCIFAL